MAKWEHSFDFIVDTETGSYIAEVFEPQDINGPLLASAPTLQEQLILAKAAIRGLLTEFVGVYELGWPSVVAAHKVLDE